MSLIQANQSIRAEGWRNYVPAASLVAATVVFLLALGFKLPSAKQPVALVFDPGVDPIQTVQRVAALDGQVIRQGGLDNIVIATFRHDIGLGQLWRHGAWFGLDPVFLGGCAEPSTKTQNGQPL